MFLGAWLLCEGFQDSNPQSFRQWERQGDVLDLLMNRCAYKASDSCHHNPLFLIDRQVFLKKNLVSPVVPLCITSHSSVMSSEVPASLA